MEDKDNLQFLHAILIDVAEQTVSLSRLATAYGTLEEFVRAVTEKHTDKIIEKLDFLKNSCYKLDDAEKNLRGFSESVKSISGRIDSILRDMGSNTDYLKLVESVNEIKVKMDGYLDLLKRHLNGDADERDHNQEMAKIKVKHKQDMEALKKNTIVKIILAGIGSGGIVIAIIEWLMGRL